MKTVFLLFALLLAINANAVLGASSALQVVDNNKDVVLQAAKPCRFEIGWTEWKPYQYLSSNNELIGLQIELIKMIAEELQCKTLFRNSDWRKSVEKIKKGQLDFVGNASINEERKKFAYFSKPYRQDLVVLYIRSKDSENYNGAPLKELLDKNKFRLGIIDIAVYDQQLTAMQRDPKYKDQFLYVRKSGELLPLLLAGEIDGYFEEPIIYDYLLMPNQYEVAVESYPMVIKMGGIHFMFSKKRVSKEFVNQFNITLERVIKNNKEKFELFY